MKATIGTSHKSKDQKLLILPNSRSLLLKIDAKSSQTRAEVQTCNGGNEIAVNQYVLPAFAKKIKHKHPHLGLPVFRFTLLFCAKNVTQYSVQREILQILALFSLSRSDSSHFRVSAFIDTGQNMVEELIQSSLFCHLATVTVVNKKYCTAFVLLPYLSVCVLLSNPRKCLSLWCSCYSSKYFP